MRVQPLHNWLEDAFSKALVFHQNGDLRNAQQIYTTILSSYPNHADTLHLLGVLKRQLGQEHEAIELINSAIQHKPNNAVYHSNLGNALRDSGATAQAEAAYLNAIALNPHFADAYNNLGVLWLRNRKIAQAFEVLPKAIALNPDHVDAYNNLGFVYKESGQIENALTCYQETLRRQPNHQDALYNVANAMFYLHHLPEAIRYFNQAYSSNSRSPTGLNASVRLGLIAYIQGDYPLAEQYLSQSTPSPPAADHHYNQMFIYREYLLNLLHWHKTHPMSSSSLPILHVIGESHMLSAAGIPMQLNETCYRTQGWWIEGCKQWHLGNPHENRFKFQFETILSLLPKRSSLMLTIGEIDCRHDEGIIAAWKKQTALSLEEMIRNTVTGYLTYVNAQAKKYSHTLILCGIPATNYPLQSLSIRDRELLIRTIEGCNNTLRSAALGAGLKFIDLYALTSDKKGLSNKKWHMDEHHLFPDAWMISQED